MTDECIDAIQAAAGRPLTDEEVAQILDALDRRRAAHRAEGGRERLEAALFDEADRLIAEVEVAAMIEKRNRLIAIKKRADFLDFAEDVDRATGDPSLALDARAVGINARIPTARQSADAAGHALLKEYLGGLIAALRADGTLAIFNSRQLEREIANELAELSKPDGRPGLTGSKEAEKIAEAVDRVRRAAVARENRAGAWIRPLAGYITRQSHDMHRMRRAGFEAWRDFILPKLDIDRTLQGADPEDFLRSAYDGLVTGVHLKANGAAENDLSFAFKGPGNLARRVSEHRVLHFKDADAWLDYNQRFGQRGLTEALVGDLERAAMNTALMETFGPNPRALWDDLIDRLKARHRGDVRKIDRLNRPSLRNHFDQVEGLTRIPVAPTAAGIGQAVRAVQSMAKLGGATLSAITDVAFKAATLAEEGGNGLEIWNKNLVSFLDGVAPGQRRATAELIGVGLDGQIGAIHARFSAQDDIPGRTSKLLQLYFKLNLLGPWTDANKRGLGLVWARDLAMQAGREFDRLRPEMQSLLGLYGIDAPRWRALRGAVRREADGVAYLMPDAVGDIADEALTEVFGAMSARRLRGLRDELSTALRSYYVDRAEAAVPTPGARERAILTQGTRPGTAAGEAMRFIAQFKAFPVTVLTRGLGRVAQADTTAEFFRNLRNGKADLLGLSHMIVGATVLGYLAQSAKELAKGRSPRDPSSPATWQAALLQGGGLGIYGDFFLGETNRFGRSLLDTAAGPTFGTIADLDELRARLFAGEDAGAGALRLITSNTPGINLFYTKLALDYLILFQLQEMANPGFLGRMERRVAREQGQSFILPPSRAVPRGGGGRIFEGVR